MKKLTRQDVTDILYGCTVLGTGGGGDLTSGLKLIEKDLLENRDFFLASLDELPDDAFVAVPYVCGAVSPTTEEEESKYADLPEIDVTAAMRAWQTMEEYCGKEFYGIVATELGGENTAEAFHVAAGLGKCIVDGDPAGRSVPELQHSTFYVGGVPIAPIAFATPFGDSGIIDSVVNDTRAEALIRAMSVVSKNTIGVVDHPMTGATLKKAIIPGTISYALKIGRTLRSANENGEDPVEAIVKAAVGEVLFRGMVKSFSWETVDGFTVGDVVISGTGDHVGSEYKIWYKNEHIVSYLNENVHVMAPDLICVLDGNGMPVTNPHYKNGMELAVFALPAPKEWQTPRGLEVFGPRAFGFDFDYRSFRDIN